MAAFPPNANGQIITFYSYKGGTGRSMALANVAWVLASNGKRVLAVDWDLEAPGLHEYFRPFLGEDPDLESTDGLIDMIVSFAGQAIQLKDLPEDLAWYEEHGNFLRYATPIQWKFPSQGRLDFVPAGRQSAAYASRVNRFDWIGFYERLGGQRFMAAFREMAQREYDYVLLDSRTGVSDTAGICTVQLPDCLVVGFTLNRQGIRGAAEVAASVNRAGSNVSRTIRIFPVPMRLDNAEKQALDESINEVRRRFRTFLDHLPENEHDEYWRGISVPYIPFYAYGELLAPLADQPSVSNSLLRPMCAIAQHISRGSVNGMPVLSEGERATTLSRYRDLLGKAKLSTTKLLQEPETHVPTSEETPEVFLSYGHQDSELVEAIANRLTEKRVRTFMAHRSLLPGESWAQEIDTAVRRASAACVFIGTSDIGPWHKKELLMLLERAAADTRSAQAFRLIPVLLPGAKPSEMPTGLTAYQWVDIRERSSWAKGVDEIVRSVRWGKPEPSVEYDPFSSSKSPYPGLRSFTEFDCPVFFGRAALVEQLADSLENNRFVVLVGSPGSGKSSLIRAGLMPKLSAAANRARKLEPVLLGPGADPLESLVRALRVTADVYGPSESEGLSHEAGLETLAVLRQLVESADSDIVLIVDGLDELASVAPSNAVRGFLEALEDLSETSRIRILLSSRSDFFQSFAGTLDIDCPHLIQRSHRYSLAPLSRTELMDAIRAPAELAGRTFEQGLVERIADEFTDVNSLPLLQQFLSTLWERARGKVITHSDYQETGGIKRFAGHSIDAVLSGLTPRTRDIAVRVLLRLLSAERARLTVSSSEFSEEERDTIEQLTAARIVRQTQVGDTRSVSLSHDAFARASIILQTQMREAEPFLAWKSRFTTYFSDWESLGRSDDFLLRGLRLREAREFMASPYGSYFSESESRYVDISRHFEAVEKRRRIANAIIIGGLLLFSILMTVLRFVRQ
jgi:energy-coupling factor transporter ATP-binding protein EcfA2